MMTKKSDFDASSSALGYIYQVRYALLAALKKIPEVEDPDDYNISIELLDDVAFDKNGNPEELLQTKYHGEKGNINNRSPDIWKTLRVWIESHNKKSIDFTKSLLFLITTESIKTKTLAFYLSEQLDKRDTDKAIEHLQDIVSTSPSKENKAGFEAFKSLSQAEVASLVSNIYIIGEAANIIELRKHIKANLRTVASKQHMEAFTTRLEGKWFKLAVESLEKDVGKINLGEFVEIIDDLREEFLPGNLPADYSNYSIDDFDIPSRNRNFIKQVELIGGGHRLIKNALENYYRAYEQRSKWSKDGLLKPGELKKYMNLLQEEWDLQCGILELRHSLKSVEGKMLFGAEIFDFCQKDGALPIRERFSPSYVARGSYHELSDGLDIGWHPDYLKLINTESEQGAA